MLIYYCWELLLELYPRTWVFLTGGATYDWGLSVYDPVLYAVNPVPIVFLIWADLWRRQLAQASGHSNPTK